MSSTELKAYAKNKKVAQWEIAEVFGVHEITLCRWLRRELPEEMQARFVAAVDSIAEARSDH